MDRYTLQSQSIVFGLFATWALVIGILHWTGHGIAMDGDKSDIAADAAK